MENTFPVYYHKNSGGQTREVIEGKSNFKQPLLLITATNVATTLLRTKITKQDVVVVGRWVAATFGVITVLALMVLAHQMHGLLAAASVGLILVTYHNLVIYSHFFKEDTALTMGMALVFLGMYNFEKYKNASSIILLGAFCGFAVAGKYIGILGLILSLPLVFLLGSENASFRLRDRLSYFFSTCLFTVAVLNYPMWSNLKTFVKGLAYEIDHVVLGVDAKSYTKLENKNSIFSEAFGEISIVLLILAGIYIVFLIMGKRKVRLSTWCLVAYPVIYLTLLQLSKYGGDTRHQLPAILFICFIGVIGLFGISKHLSLDKRISGFLAIALLVFVLPGQFTITMAKLSEIPMDSRVLLREWVAENLPVNAKIAQDLETALPDPDAKHHENDELSIAQTVHSAKYAADLGTIDQLRKQGFTHVAMSDRYTRLFDDNRMPHQNIIEEHNKRKQFYTQLFNEGELIWDSRLSEAPQSGFFGKRMRLFEL